MSPDLNELLALDDGCAVWHSLSVLNRTLINRFRDGGAPPTAADIGIVREQRKRIDEAFAVLDIDSSEPDSYYHHLSLGELWSDARSVRWLKEQALHGQLQTPEAMAHLDHLTGSGGLSWHTLGRFVNLLVGGQSPAQSAGRKKRGGGPKPTPLEQKRAIVHGWLLASRRGELMASYAARTGISVTTLWRWENELRDNGEI